MRILILNSEFPPLGGGAGKASQHLAQELSALGHEVTLLTSAFKGLPWDEEQDGVRIIRIPTPRRFLHRSTAFEQLLFMLGLTLWGFFWNLSLKPDAILAFFGAPSGVAAWVWNWFRRTPYVVLLRGGDVPGFRPYDFAHLHRMLAPLLRRVWRGAAAVVANSQGLKALGTTFEPQVPIRVIPNGVSAMGALDKRVWSPARMLFVGRLVYQKGLDVLFDALAELSDLEWDLDIVGDGPRMNWLQQRAQELGLAERVRFLGWQAREALPAIFTRANLFAYPSRHEGMPNALLEAMAAGLPSVATRIAGNEELIEDGVNGYLVAPEDAVVMKEKLAVLLKDEVARKKMGAAARRKAEQDYTWEAAAKAYADLLHEIRGA